MNEAAARIARARHLAVTRPACAQILAFYADLVGMQQALLARLPGPPGRGAPPAFREALQADAIASLIPEFLDWLRRTPHGRLAEAAATLQNATDAEWQCAIERYWITDPDPSGPLDETRLFVVESVLQPFAERLAADRSSAIADRARADTSDRATRCPVCAGLPIVATLREQGHGARRSMVCGLCLTEFPVHRIVCSSCGQADFDALPVYRSEDLSGVRVDACDGCRTYIKTIDLTQSALAVPAVDDLASLPLDLWAREQGYRKRRPNLLRI